jgi:hypothetical protein
MRRIGYFSIRGYWLSPLAVFVTIVVGGVAVPGGHSLGIGLLGFGVACSLIIAFILSITATLNQNNVEMMHEVDSSLLQPEGSGRSIFKTVVGLTWKCEDPTGFLE